MVLATSEDVSHTTNPEMQPSHLHPKRVDDTCRSGHGGFGRHQAILSGAAAPDQLTKVWLHLLIRRQKSVDSALAPYREQDRLLSRQSAEDARRLSSLARKPGVALDDLRDLKLVTLRRATDYGPFQYRTTSSSGGHGPGVPKPGIRQYGMLIERERTGGERG